MTASSFNHVNQLTGQGPGGDMVFTGTVNKPALMTVGGNAATVDAANHWAGHAAVSVGSNAIPLVAVDGNGGTTSKTISVTVTGGGARSLAYDANGSMLNNGAGQTYAWDVANRLVKITQSSGVTEFVYDGAGRRVQEKFNGSIIKQWVWCGGAQPCEERDASNNVTKRFYGGLGEQIGGVGYFYTSDHLGSMREMTDGSGAIRARYDYDPYGRITKVSGDLEADFGFTSFYRHQASGLNLTLFRAYDANLGRWLSRDPIGEDGGINLYGYVLNNPISSVDPLGLQVGVMDEMVGVPIGYKPGVPQINQLDAEFQYAVQKTAETGAVVSAPLLIPPATAAPGVAAGAYATANDAVLLLYINLYRVSPPAAVWLANRLDKMAMNTPGSRIGWIQAIKDTLNRIKLSQPTKRKCN